MSRDRQEAEAASKNAPLELKVIYLQMAMARRSEPPLARHRTPNRIPPLDFEASRVRNDDDDDIFNSKCTAWGPLHAVLPQTSAMVAEFRRERGLVYGGDGSSSSSAPFHMCTSSCKHAKLGPDLWICEASGAPHTCAGDRPCDLCVRDTSGLPVCPVSGQCFGRMVDFEEGGGDDEAAGAGDDWNVDETGGGRLGRAFSAGYHAADGREMLLRFGIHL
jgi:hypothetical protein